LGFTGLRISEGDWRKYPAILPAGWKRMEIDRIWIRGKPFRMTAEQEKPAALVPNRGENHENCHHAFDRVRILRPCGRGSAGPAFASAGSAEAGDHRRFVLDAQAHHLGNRHDS
jgi:hypothetical protein